MPLILLIEDDPTQRLAAGFALKRAGHTVLEAADGEQGLAMARADRPELIICDVLMPGLNGYQMVTKLRREETICDIPVIMLTAMAGRAHVRLGMTAGADDYLAKPFSSQELCDAVTALLARRKVQHAQIISTVMNSFQAALDEQKHALSLQYETQLVLELGARWARDGNTASELKYPDATVLVIDLFAALLAQPKAGGELGNEVRRSYQGACDALFLFGARHVLPHGNDLLAVFASTPDESAHPRLRALRAAFALAKSPSAQAEGIVIAMHEGELTLLRVSDPLHGGPESTLATGEGLTDATSIREFAATSGWRIACSQSSASGLQQHVSTGRRGSITRGRTLPPFEVIELLALA